MVWIRYTYALKDELKNVAFNVSRTSIIPYDCLKLLKGSFGGYIEPFILQRC